MTVRRALHLLTLSSLLAFASSARAQPRPPAGGVVIEGGDSAEWCDYQYLTTARLDGRETPSASGRVVRTVAPGRRIDANDRSEAWTVVRRPGRLRAERALTLEGVRSFGDRTTIRPRATREAYTTLRISAGDTVEYLMDAGEGYAYFRYRGVTYLGEGIHVGPYRYEDRRGSRQVVDFTALTEPATELWLRLVPRDGRPAAWVEVRGRVEEIGCSGEAE